MNFEKQKLSKVEKEKLIEEFDLRELKRGDGVVIETGDSPENISTYKISLIGREKGRPRIKAENEYFYKGELEKSEIFTARWLAGGFDALRLGGRKEIEGLSQEEQETIKNIVKNGDRLYFENVKDEHGERQSLATRTMPITKILEIVRKAEDKK